MNRIIVIIAFLSLSMGMRAQQDTRLWTLTPKVGINSSKMSVEDLWTDL